MGTQTKTMVVKSDTAFAETKTTIRDTATFDISKLPNGITYKGLKAVLSFADPIQWNKASTYDSLTVVWDYATHASYASKRPVPQNIELTNEFYWLRTADLDAQVEMYRQEVMQFDGRITANKQAIDELNTTYNGVSYTNRTNTFAVFSDSTFQRNGDFNNPGITIPSVVDNMTNLMPNATIKNYGKGGTGTDYLVNTLNKLAVDNSVDTVLIAYGTNDWQGSFESAPILSSQKSPRNTELNAIRAIKRARVIFPKAKLIWFTPAYIHSEAFTELNVNDCASTPFAYYDVINRVCNEYGIQCVRLDKFFNVNETTYKNFMVASTENIWVHYNADTTLRIATLIADNFAGIDVEPNTPQGYKILNLPSYTKVDTRFHSHAVYRTIKCLLPNGVYTLHGYTYGENDITINGKTYKSTISSYLSLDFEVTDSTGLTIITLTSGLYNAAILPKNANYFNVTQNQVYMYKDAECNFTLAYDGVNGTIFGDSVSVKQEYITLPSDFPFEGNITGFYDIDFKPLYGRIGAGLMTFSERFENKYMGASFNVK